MAVVMDQHQQQQQPYNYYCRICKKGLGCGRSLGGHMRAHGITDAPPCHADNDDDPSACSEWGDGGKANPPVGGQRMYSLRANPNRLRGCRVCENCGEEFISWKSFLEHGRCSSDDEDGGGGNSNGEDDLRGCAAWSKGKRSRRTKAVPPVAGGVVPSSEEEDLANCLVMLSASRVEPVVVLEAEESCASESRGDGKPWRYLVDATPVSFAVPADKYKAPATAPPPPRGVFACKACKKVFISHQALGGHRASHKKVKGCFAAKLQDQDGAAIVEEDDPTAHGSTSNNNKNNKLPHGNISNSNNNNNTGSDAFAMVIVPFDQQAPLSVAPLQKKSKLHECSICHRVFPTGQALGGHKRCHWITSNAAATAAAAGGACVASGSAEKHKLHSQHQHPQRELRPIFRNLERLDLNLPAPGDEIAGLRSDVQSPLRLDVPAAIYLQSGVDKSNNKNTANTSSSSNNNTVNNNQSSNPTTVDDEADSKIKLAKLSELKDINMSGESSPWLQVGIGSSDNTSDQ